MRSRQENGLLALLWIWIAYLAVFQCGAAQAAAGLSRNEVLGYARWLQALNTVTEEPALYPLGMNAEEIVADSIERRLTAARAVIDYEETASRAWDRSDFTREHQSLNHARSSREILDFADALQWYRSAIRARGASGPDGELVREILVTAIMSGDSLQILEQLINVVGTTDLSDRTAAIVLAYRHYLHTRDRTNLELLMEKVGTQLGRLPGEVLFWHAFALIHLDRRAEAMPLLTRLSRDARLSATLTRDHVLWFVQALPDNLLLLDRRRDAIQLYQLLAVTEHNAGAAWANYQLANAYLLEGRYTEAGHLYGEACDVEDPTPWQERACTLAKTVAVMAEIKKEGERHGTDAIHDR